MNNAKNGVPQVKNFNEVEKRQNNQNCTFMQKMAPLPTVHLNTSGCFLGKFNSKKLGLYRLTSLILEFCPCNVKPKYH
jgi:hypothetical protein